MLFTTLCAILGPICILVAIAMGLHIKQREKTIHAIENHHGFSFMINVIRAVIGFTLYTVIEVSMSPVDIGLKVAGGIIALIGAICLLFPTVEQHIIKTTAANKIPLFVIMLITQGLIGVVMMYVGYST